jgi:hypothetical protein
VELWLQLFSGGKPPDSLRRLRRLWAEYGFAEPMLFASFSRERAVVAVDLAPRPLGPLRGIMGGMRLRRASAFCFFF